MGSSCSSRTVWRAGPRVINHGYRPPRLRFEYAPSVADFSGLKCGGANQTLAIKSPLISDVVRSRTQVHLDLVATATVEWAVRVQNEALSISIVFGDGESPSRVRPCAKDAKPLSLPAPTQHIPTDRATGGETGELRRSTTKTPLSLRPRAQAR